MPSLDLAHTRPQQVTKPPLDQSAGQLLRKDQVADKRDQLKSMERKIKAAGQPFGGTTSIADTRRAMSRVKHELDEQAPRPFEAAERDDAIAAERLLRDQITVGMPTAEEMRKNPPGAVGKNIAWEKRNKKKILAWKNIRRRLQASGMLESGDGDGADVGNVERLRKHSDNYQLAMDHAQVKGNGKLLYLPDVIDPKNTMSDLEREEAERETILVMQKIGQMPKTERAKLLTKAMGL